MGKVEVIENRVLVYGDIHLSSRNYGAHRDYAKESLSMLKNITDTAKSIGATHIIGLGDFSYGRFNTLEYRMEVEKQLEEQYVYTHGNRYELKGNHDKASYGMTEYEYYIQKGLLKPSCNLVLGRANISMVDFGEHRKHTIIPPDSNMHNIVCMHDFFRFRDTQIPDYGKAVYLDEFEPWYGVDTIIGGHIHNYSQFEGNIADMVQHKSNRVLVTYLGCPCRPSYREGHMQDYGVYAVITTGTDSNGEQQVEENLYTFQLWDLEESFNLADKADTEALRAMKHVDVSDIVKQLDSHERVAGDPEQVVMGMLDIDARYREKAIDYLKRAMG